MISEKIQSNILFTFSGNIKLKKANNLIENTRIKSKYLTGYIIFL